jgi:predicted ATP-grasp superfamily ATP-dependent carboligase
VTGTVLVTDANERAALAVVRSVGRSGIRVVTCASTTPSLAGRSRFSARSAVVPDPLRQPDAFAKSVAILAREEGAGVILPIGEPALLALLEHRPQVAPAVIPWPALDVVRAICDKRGVLDAAPGFGIRVPRQVVVSSREDHLPQVVFPVVIKPARSVGEAGGVRQKLTVRYADSLQELHRALAGYSAAAYPLLLQERVTGPGVGVFLLLWDGVLRASFAHRRLREKPPAGGVSVYSESVAPDEALVQRAFRLLQSLGWQGIAMVEFKTDDRTGEPVLMEINGRFWGSLQLAIDAGVDFPRLLLECAAGQPAPVPAPYRVGTRLRWWWGDVDQLLLRLPAGSAVGTAALRDFLRLRLSDRAETFRWNDPLPFLHESRQWLAEVMA